PLRPLFPYTTLFRSLAGELGVALEVTRVRGQVLAGTELQRVDEDRRHHHVALGPGLLHERHVPRVEIAHRRHEPDRSPRGPFGIDRKSTRLNSSHLV